MNSKIHLVYASDENYVFYAAVAAMSARVTTKRPNDLIIHVLDNGITDASWNKWLEKTGAVRHKIDFDKDLSLKSMDGSIATYSRLFIEDILPDVDWCVYADVDTLFIGDIFEMAEQYLPSIKRDDVAIMGVPDPHFKKDTHLRHNGQFAYEDPWYKRHSINPENYICAGFILMNLSFLRKSNFKDNAFKLLREDPQVLFYDQCVINHLLQKNIKPLDLKWGLLSICIDECNDEIGLLHYAGHAPWMSFIHYAHNSEIWHAFARVFFGISRRNYMLLPVWMRKSKIPGCKYLHPMLIHTAGRLYFFMEFCLYHALAWCPALQRKFIDYKSVSLPRRYRHLKSKRYWEEKRLAYLTRVGQ